MIRKMKNGLPSPEGFQFLVTDFTDKDFVLMSCCVCDFLLNAVVVKKQESFYVNDKITAFSPGMLANGNIETFTK